MISFTVLNGEPFSINVCVLKIELSSSGGLSARERFCVRFRKATIARKIAKLRLISKNIVQTRLKNILSKTGCSSTHHVFRKLPNQGWSNVKQFLFAWVGYSGVRFP